MGTSLHPACPLLSSACPAHCSSSRPRGLLPALGGREYRPQNTKNAARVPRGGPPPHARGGEACELHPEHGRPHATGLLSKSPGRGRALSRCPLGRGPQGRAVLGGHRPRAPQRLALRCCHRPGARADGSPAPRASVQLEGRTWVSGKAPPGLTTWKQSCGRDTHLRWFGAGEAALVISLPQKRSRGRPAHHGAPSSPHGCGEGSPPWGTPSMWPFLGLDDVGGGSQPCGDPVTVQSQEDKAGNTFTPFTKLPFTLL